MTTLASHDLEDLIAVIDGRAELPGEIQASENAVRTYIGSEIKRLNGIQEFVDALPGHLPPDPASQARIRTLKSSLEKIAAL
jgi:hypothetical protein